MKQLLIVGEDRLCLVLGRRMVEVALPGWHVSAEVDKKGITNLVPRLSDYALQAKHVMPVLCVADTDGACAAELTSQWRPSTADARFLLRLAVPEAESWAMADGDGFARAMSVPRALVPRDPESLTDAKRTVLQLARRSTSRRVREEVVSMADPTQRGNGYNAHLCGFVRTTWRPDVAEQSADSLARAMGRLREWVT